MNPVIPNFIPFTVAWVDAIRENRIQRLAEGLAARDQKTRKPRGPRAAPKRKPVTLRPRAQAALDGMDEETRQFLLDAIK